MLTYNLKNKGQITQYFDGNATGVYKQQGDLGHGALDFYIGHRKPVVIDNAGFCYKHFDPFELAENWTGVYILSPTGNPDEYMEVCIGHFVENKVKTGDNVQAGQVVGLQGNYGLVFAGKKQITVEQQKAGVTAGSHVHESWRLVKRTKRPQGHCLLGKDGRKYRDAEKFYYQIVYQDNGYKGMIDPIGYTKGFTQNRDIGAIEKQLKITLQQTINLLQTKILTLKKQKGIV